MLYKNRQTEIVLTLTFDGTITEKNKFDITENVARALLDEVQKGTGIAPDGGDVITENIFVEGEGDCAFDVDVKSNTINTV